MQVIVSSRRFRIFWGGSCGEVWCGNLFFLVNLIYGPSPQRRLPVSEWRLWLCVPPARIVCAPRIFSSLFAPVLGAPRIVLGHCPTREDFGQKTRRAFSHEVITVVRPAFQDRLCAACFCLFDHLLDAYVSLKGSVRRGGILLANKQASPEGSSWSPAHAATSVPRSGMVVEVGIYL